METKQHNYNSRQDIPQQQRWNLTDLYTSEEIWQQDLEKVKESLKEIAQYKGKVADTAANLYQVLTLKDQLLAVFEKVTAYAMLHRDENTADQHYQGLVGRVTGLGVDVESALSFIHPEIIALKSEKLDKYLSEHEQLAVYHHFLKNLHRQKQHYRSTEVEEIIALTGEMAEAPRSIFSLLTNADMEFPDISVDGKAMPLTQGNFIEYLQSEHRLTRKAAYETLYQTYSQWSNTLGSAYSSSVKSDLFQAKVRRYKSALEAALDPDNIPVSLYDNLLSAVHKHLPALHRYTQLKKQALGVDELKPYDLYVPLTGQSRWAPSIDETKDTITKGLSVMGSEYTSLLDTAFNDRWMDVYETKGKRSGAYSWGAYGAHPYVLLNYQPNLDSVFTVAHELGHALHSYYTNKNQPYIYSHYPIFLAEVASTVNEALLFQHLLAKADPQEKIALLEKNLEQFRGTVFRQVMFAEFEQQVHELAEAGEPLTPDKLSQVYADLLTKYYGPDLAVDDYIRWEWSRIPHFYSAFYVYKYATGFSSAVAISETIVDQGQAAVERYMEFLRSGAADYPLDILAKAGVDLTTRKPLDSALNVFEQRLSEFENLLENK